LFGLIGASIEVRIIWYQNLGSKIRFTILLPFVSCCHPILFLLYSLFLVFVCIVHQVQKKKKKKKKRRPKKKNKKREMDFTKKKERKKKKDDIF
jgi:predicted membrane protein